MSHWNGTYSGFPFINSSTSSCVRSLINCRWCLTFHTRYRISGTSIVTRMARPISTHIAVDEALSVGNSANIIFSVTIFLEGNKQT